MIGLMQNEYVGLVLNFASKVNRQLENWLR